MREYQLNGCLLGWLIDRINKKIHIYRQDGAVEVKVNIPVKLSGEDILPGLIVETKF